MEGEFLSGVVEGFYGQPWSLDERLSLFDRLAQWGLNTYFYAPKDDLKHRALWRDPYDEPELARMRQLIETCRSRQIRFIYGLSPGLDIRFSDAAELERVRNRFAQLVEIGCLDFALLFDDLPGSLAKEDQVRFGNVAAAQTAVANAVRIWLLSQGVNARFLFCPTAYCDRMARWQLGGADYLDTLGKALDPDIDVLWTGPEIVSREIPVDSVERLAERIRRRPVIWDNLHANDYDVRRLYCGPYAGRPLEMRDAVRGILTNPNNEFPINFIPIRTLASYVCADTHWDARAAYLLALEEWHAFYVTVGKPLTLEELILLGDAYYLPHEEGPEARRLLDLIDSLVRLPVDEWGTRHQDFTDLNRRVQSLFDRLTELKNRELFYAWSRRVWDLKEELQLFDAYFTAKAAGELADQGYAPETHLPGTYRGGIVARMQRVLKMDEVGRFHPRPAFAGSGVRDS